MNNTTIQPTRAAVPPYRLAVLLRLQLLLEEICKADGDLYDMQGHVHINRLLFGAEVQQAHEATLSIIEAPRPDFATFAGDGDSRADRWTLMIQGTVPDDKSVDTEYLPYYFCQDVEKRLLRITEVKGSGSPKYPNDYRLGDMISSVEVAPPVVRPPEAQVSSHAFFYLPIRLGIAVEIGQ
jgi:hypothetical protein